MRTFLFIACMIFAITAHGQFQTDNLYNRAFERHIDEYYDNMPNQLFVKMIDGVTDYISEDINGVAIKFLNQKNLVKLSKKGAVVIVIKPINIESEITLEIGEYYCNYKNRKVQLVKQGHSFFTIGYVDGRYIITSDIHEGL